MHAFSDGYFYSPYPVIPAVIAMGTLAQMDAFDILLESYPSPNAGCKRQFNDYDEVEQRLGISLPDDFKGVNCYYGPGLWMNELWVLDPLDSRMAALWDPQRSYVMKHLTLAPCELDGGNPLPAWPAPGGVLPWGGTQNGGYMLWLTEGDPNEWSTIYRFGREPDSGLYEMSCSEFLLESLRGNIAEHVFPESDSRPFVPE